MNFDLITKLAKLANNNPNDNEANAAARKVCKLLAEGKFKFNEPKVNLSQQYNPTTWNDVQRSTEPMRSSKTSASNYDPKSTDYFWEIFNEYARSHPYDSSGFNPPKPQEKRPLKCRKCNQMFDTAFVGPEVMYTCYKCQWSPGT